MIPEIEFEMGVDEEEISSHPRPDFSHETVPMWNKDHAVDVDVHIAPVIGAMWDYGIETLFCCEGYDVPDGEDAAGWDWRNHRAYVLFKHTEESYRWLLRVMATHPFLDHGANSMDGWEISLDAHAEQGRRICIRFPKNQIGSVYGWFLWDKARYGQ